MSNNGKRLNMPIPGLSSPEQQAHASLAVSSDATALPAVVSTPSTELPHPFFATGNLHGQEPASPTTQRQGKQQINGNRDEDATALVAGQGSSSASTLLTENLRQLASSSATRSSSLKRTNATVSLQEAAAAGTLHKPVCFPAFETLVDESGKALQDATASSSKMVLELADGTAFQGFSFGAKSKSISGECVFQTGKIDLIAQNTQQTLLSHHFYLLETQFPFVNDECYVGTSL